MSQYHPASSATKALWSVWPGGSPSVTARVIALLNAGRPPSSGSFSR